MTTPRSLHFMVHSVKNAPETDLNTIANALRGLLGSDATVANGWKIYTESTSKELFRADLTGRAPPSTLPVTRFTEFSKARGVIIDARSDCAQR